MKKSTKLLSVLLIAIYAFSLFSSLVIFYLEGQSSLIAWYTYGGLYSRLIICYHILMIVLCILLCIKSPKVKRQYVLIGMAFLIFAAHILQWIQGIMPLLNATAGITDDIKKTIINYIFKAGGLMGEVLLLIITIALCTMCRDDAAL